MKATDNMGGIISAYFVPTTKVKNFVTVNNECQISFMPGAGWMMLPSKAKGITLNVTATLNDAGCIFEISGSVMCKESSLLNTLRHTSSILLHYTTSNGVSRVAGTNEYPLIATLVPLTPTKTSDFSGYEIKFEGKQLFEPPIIIQ